MCRERYLYKNKHCDDDDDDYTTVHSHFLCAKITYFCRLRHLRVLLLFFFACFLLRCMGDRQTSKAEGTVSKSLFAFSPALRLKKRIMYIYRVSHVTERRHNAGVTLNNIYKAIFVIAVRWIEALSLFVEKEKSSSLPIVRHTTLCLSFFE